MLFVGTGLAVLNFSHAVDVGIYSLQFYCNRALDVFFGHEVAGVLLHGAFESGQQTTLSYVKGPAESSEYIVGTKLEA